MVLGAIFLLALVLALNLCKMRTLVKEVLKRRTPKGMKILFSVGKAVSERSEPQHESYNH